MLLLFSNRKGRGTESYKRSQASSSLADVKEAAADGASNSAQLQNNIVGGIDNKQNNGNKNFLKYEVVRVFRPENETREKGELGVSSSSIAPPPILPAVGLLMVQNGKTEAKSIYYV